MSIILGITGGIGSGKSTVSTILKLCGIPVYIADVESKKLTDSSAEIKKQLIELFGKEIYSADAKLNKALLASHIFADKEKLNKVNSIIHPVVKNDLCEWIASNVSHHVVATESAILFESGFDSIVDKTILVYTPLEERISRIVKRDSSSYDKAIERIKSQMPDEDKIKLVDHVIVNDESKSLIEQTLSVISNLK